MVSLIEQSCLPADKRTSLWLVLQICSLIGAIQTLYVAPKLRMQALQQA